MGLIQIVLNRHTERSKINSPTAAVMPFKGIRVTAAKSARLFV